MKRTQDLTLIIILKMIGMGLAYTTIAMIGRLYGAEELGWYVTFIANSGVIVMALKFGVDSLILKKSSLSQSNKPRTRRTPSPFVVSQLFIINTALMVLTLYLVKRFLHITINHLQLILFAVPQAVIFLSSAYIQSDGRRFSFVLTSSIIFPLIFLAILSVRLFTDVSLPFALMTSIFIASVVVVAMTAGVKDIKGFPYLRRSIFRWRELGNVYKNSLMFFLAGGSTYILSVTDILSLQLFLTTEEIGLYGAAQRISSVVGLSLYSVNVVFTPKIAAYYQDDDIYSIKRIYFFGVRSAVKIGLPIAVMTAVMSPFLLRAMSAEFEPAIYTTLILIIGYFVNIAFGPIGNMLLMIGATKKYIIIILTAAIIQVSLNALLIPSFGINGGACATAATMVFWNATMFLCAVKFFKQSL